MEDIGVKEVVEAAVEVEVVVEEAVWRWKWKCGRRLRLR
jgi:hypothetical protein